MRLLEPAVVFSGANQVSIKIAFPKSVKFRVFFIIGGSTGGSNAPHHSFELMRKTLTKLKEGDAG